MTDPAQYTLDRVMPSGRYVTPMRPASVDRKTGRVHRVFDQDHPDKVRNFIRAHKGCYSPRLVYLALPVETKAGDTIPNWQPVKGEYT
jgi:hypothetical protein